MPQWEREDSVADVLESMMLRLLKPEVRAPKEMAAYLARVLHNRLVDVSRRRGGREATQHGVADSSDVDVARLIAAPDTADSTASSMSPALERLARALVDPLTDEERQLIGWESNMIPHRTIAAWLGVSHAAATKRIWRLRARLREVALRYSASLASAEHREIMRVIRRNEAAESGRRSEAAEAVSLEGSRGLRRRAGQSGQGGTGG
jgi:DNA-directed RNA polymerase specialized sigma24 family protein